MFSCLTIVCVPDNSLKVCQLFPVLSLRVLLICTLPVTDNLGPLSFCQYLVIRCHSESLRHLIVVPVDTYRREINGAKELGFSVCVHVCQVFQPLGVSMATQQ